MILSWGKLIIRKTYAYPYSRIAGRRLVSSFATGMFMMGDVWVCMYLHKGEFCWNGVGMSSMKATNQKFE